MIYLVSSMFLGFLLLGVYVIYYYYMYRVNKRSVSWNKSEISKKVSLIVATYNEEDTIVDKIRNIMELDYDKNNLELLIIDSGSTDKTPEILVKIIEGSDFKKNIVFIRENERMGKSHALNIAYPRATGEIKIISDADAKLEKNALQQIVNNFNDPAIGAACGRQVLVNPDQSGVTQLEKSYRGFYEILRAGESKLDSTPIFHGELSAYRAELIDRLPENKSADDSRLANLIRFKGYRAVYDSDAVFYEYAPMKWGSRMTQKVRRAQGLVRLFWDLRGGLFSGKLGAYGKIILPFEFLMHCVFPTLWVIITLSFFVNLLFFNVYLFSLSVVLLAAVYMMTKIGGENFVVSRVKGIAILVVTFLSSQGILFYALLLWVSGRSLHKWKKVDDVRKGSKKASEVVNDA